MTESTVSPATESVVDRASDRGTTAATPTTPVGISGGYQPALDGLRAVAVGMVIVFHLGLAGYWSPLSGGWLGVDVFFVLSGYLITSLLLAERGRTGTTNLRNFYARRLLRLAPLSILLVAVCWIGGRIGLRNVFDLSLPTKGAISVLFYFSNWMYLWKPGSTGSMMHAWSLSIEEQFYLLWPTLVVVAFIVAKRHARWILLGVAGAGAGAMALYRRHLWYQATATGSGSQIWDTWERFYFSSLQRPDGLLIGCACALVIHRVRPGRTLRRVASVFGVGAALLIALIVDRSAFKLWTPWAALLPAWGLSAMNVCVAVLIVALVWQPTSVLARALSFRPLCWIGRRAYGIYLIHPLVVAALEAHRSISPFWASTTIVVVSFGLAGISFRWFETPFLRYKNRFATPTNNPGESDSTEPQPL